MGIGCHFQSDTSFSCYGKLAGILSDSGCGFLKHSFQRILNDAVVILGDGPYFKYFGSFFLMNHEQNSKNPSIPANSNQMSLGTIYIYIKYLLNIYFMYIKYIS